MAGDEVWKKVAGSLRSWKAMYKEDLAIQVEEVAGLFWKKSEEMERLPSLLQLQVTGSTPSTIQPGTENVWLSRSGVSIVSDVEVADQLVSSGDEIVLNNVLDTVSGFMQ